ncbi:uncharacterized protein LOC144559336 [Carex rostrata]
MFMILAWGIWKARCAFLFQNKTCDPERTLANALVQVGSQKLILSQPTPKEHAGLTAMNLARFSASGYCCQSDGSFDHNENGGAAFVCKHDGILIGYELNPFVKATSPFHMETIALLMAIQNAVNWRIEECVFYTDSETLVKLLASDSYTQALQAVDWRSYSELMRVVLLLKSNAHYRCVFIPREDNLVAHQLANVARSGQFYYKGYTYPLFSTFESGCTSRIPR